MEIKAPINVKALVTWVVLGVLVGWQANSLWDSQSGQASTVDVDNPAKADMSLFWEVWSEVSDQYYDAAESDSQEKVYGAAAGLVESLEDPYSVFMTPQETKDFNSSLEGELKGIGAELTQKEDKLVIVSPLKGSPAEQAGLKPEDYVVMINGEVTSGMKLWDAIQKIRGEEGTSVKLTILREGQEAPLEFNIVRQAIIVPSVKLAFTKENDKTIAHLALYQFANDSYAELSNAIQQILLENADGMILDLRMNGGGYLDVSVDILSEFFKDQQRAVIVKRHNQENEVLYTKGNGKLADIPLVVLIDEGSASASEIVAGALQDYKRAMLMGATSFGKGSVQELHSLKDGSSLRLTIAKWFTPLDRTISEVGITPDQIVEMDIANLDTENDTQLQKALEYLENL